MVKEINQYNRSPAEKAGDATCPCKPWCPGRKSGCHTYCVRYLAYEKRHMAETQKKAEERAIQQAIDAPLIKRRRKRK